MVHAPTVVMIAQWLIVYVVAQMEHVQDQGPVHILLVMFVHADPAVFPAEEVHKAAAVRHIHPVATVILQVIHKVVIRNPAEEHYPEMFITMLIEMG